MATTELGTYLAKQQKDRKKEIHSQEICKICSCWRKKSAQRILNHKTISLKTKHTERTQTLRRRDWISK